ncbi:phage tail tape measure protein [Embleya sp. NPDC005971]|uniref:phage tail tape measure protein n=1 Tax=Embleya sp. NPDC005971 TaxID=3156724 RepID=UPI0033EFC064
MASIENLFVVLHAEAAPFIRGMSAATASGETFAARMGGMAAVGQRMVAGLGVVGLAVAAVSVKMAGDFEQQIMRLHTSAGESRANLEMIGNGIMSIARATGTATEQLTAGAYKIESAGYHGADALKVLKAAAEGAKAEQADLDTVSNALTSTMKAYKASVGDASEYMSKYVAIVSHGKVSMQELASAMPNVEAVASAAHVSFNELGGAMATMTTHGESAHQAAQWLSFAIRNLEAPNMVAVKAMEQLGLSSTDVAQHLGERGLTGTMRLISETILGKMGPSGQVMIDTLKRSASAADDANRMMKAMPEGVANMSKAYLQGDMSLAQWKADVKQLPSDQAAMANQFKVMADRVNGFSDVIKAGGPAAVTYQDQLKKIMGGASGMQAALQLTGSYMPDFEANVKAVTEATTDANGHVEGFTASQETLNAKLAVVKQAFATLMIEIGQRLIPVVKAIVDWFLQHREAAKFLAVVIGGILVGAVIALGIAIATAMGPIGWIAAAIVVLIYLGGELAAHWGEIWGWIKDVAASAWGFLVDGWNWFLDKTKAIWDSITGAATGAWRGLVGWASGAWHAVADPLVRGWRWLSDTTSSIWNGISGFFRKWWPLLLVIFLPPIALIVAIWNRTHSAIADFCRNTWNSIVAFLAFIWSGISQAASWAWSQIQSYVVDPTMATWRWLVGIWDKAAAALSAVWSWISGVASDAWGGIKSAIVDPLTSAWHWVESIGSSIGTAIYDCFVGAYNSVKDVGSWFYGVGSAIVQGIINGVSGAGGGLVSKLRGLASDALGAAKSFLGISSPSRVFAEMVGRPIAEGVAAGVGDHTPTAVRAVRGMSRALLASPGALAMRAPGTALVAGAGASAGGTQQVTNINVHVAGSVMSERELFDTVQQQALRYNRRNPTSGLSLTGGR